MAAQELIWFNMNGGCMRPLLHEGELLPVRPADPREIRPGDVVLYRVGEKHLLHRVRRRDDKSFWMKDDTGTVELHRIPVGHVLGRLEVRGRLSRGRLGLAYSRINTAVFVMGRRVKACFRALGAIPK